MDAPAIGAHFPKASGFLHGGGLQRYRARRSVARGCKLINMPDVHMSDAWMIRRVIPDFDPSLTETYTDRELMLMAEKMLLMDPKPFNQDPYWLSYEQLRRREKREIHVASGTPDPHIVEGLYWRTHPDGRGVHTEEQRKQGRSSFYKDGGRLR